MEDHKKSLLEPLHPGSYEDPEAQYVPKNESRPTKTDPVYESLDYDRCENQLYRDRFVATSESNIAALKAFTANYNMWRWLTCAAIGFFTAMVGFFIDFMVHKISSAKFAHIGSVVADCVGSDPSRADAVGCLFNPWVQLTAINVVFVGIAATMTVYIAPSAAGSGIPEIKSFLNGIKHKSWLTFKTMAVKVIGVLFSVSATMPVGKEGPMIHSGAIIGAGLPQAKSTRLGIDLKKTSFRNDRAKRDFVSAGAASGVSAAFGSPIGGVLFSLEEGASFWNQSLTWRTLFSTMIALLVLHLFQGPTLRNNEGGETVTWGHGLLVSGGLLSFGNFEDYKRSCLVNQTTNELIVSTGSTGDSNCETPLWRIQDLAVFLLMAVFGGLAGAAWNALQTKITVMRTKYLTKSWQRIVEALLIAFVNTTLLYIAALYFGRCQEQHLVFGTTLRDEDFRNYFCNTDSNANDEYNDMATLALNPLEVTIKVLLHSQTQFALGTCILLFVLLFVTSCWTYGLMIPSGLFVPALVTGATFGRFVGEIFYQYDAAAYRGTYALIGAAAFLGGVVRMTISLTVILLEATNEITYGLPIMATLLVAKWVGDYFNKGIYDIHIELRGIPLLEWESEEEMKRYLAKDVMSTDLIVLNPVMTVSEIIDILQSCKHNGFPVVDPATGQYKGMLLRSYVITLLQTKAWADTVEAVPKREHHDFVIRYPQRTPVESVPIPRECYQKVMHLEPYMNPSTFTIEPDTPLPRTFLLYRSIGLRHIPVLDSQHRIVGIVTRKELTEEKLHELSHHH